MKVWVSFLDLIKPLYYDEIGRLFEMMLIYAESGKEPDDFEGNERFLWPVAKQQIDLAAEKNEILRQNGMKGGRPKNAETKANQTEPNETKRNQTKAYKEKERKEIESKEKERNEKEGLIDDADAREIQHDHDRILDAAGDAGFVMGNSVRAALIRLYSEHGLQKVLDGIDSCVKHGAPNLAYLEACMKDKPKPGKVLNAQNFQQRDYSSVDDELKQKLAEEMAAFKESQRAVSG